jgi:hypothetical protein
MHRRSAAQLDGVVVWLRSLGRMDQHAIVPPELGIALPRDTSAVQRPSCRGLSGPRGGQDHVVFWCADLGRLAGVSDEMSDNGSARELPWAAVDGRGGRLKGPTR